MKRFSSQLHKKAQSIKLSAAERSDLRERLVSYMEYHPLPKAVSKATTSSQIVSEPYKVLKINYTYLSSVMGSLAAIVLVIVPIVAERAVPGDVLYPVKVQFNEEVRSTLSLSPYAKIEWETKRLERRLAEARLLADEGRLTEAIEAEVAEAVQAHSEAAQMEIASIRVNDQDEAALAEITLATALDVQSEVLASREGQAGEQGRSVAILASAVAEVRDGVEASHGNTDLSFEKLLGRIELETTNAEELFASIKASASVEEVTNIERRFSDIQRKVAEATALQFDSLEATDTATTSPVVDVESEKAAKALLKAALSDTRKLISFMTDIDVRNNISIDELVPVSLTTEEKASVAAEGLAAAQSKTQLLIAATPPEAVAEKYGRGQEILNETLNKAVGALKVGDYEATIAFVVEAEAMISDLNALLKVKTNEVPDPSVASSTESVVIASSTATSTETEIGQVEGVSTSTAEDAEDASL